MTRPVGDTVPMGAGAYATIDALEPYRHLVAQEAYVLRPLPGNKTRLVMRYRGLGFVAPADRAIRPDAGPVPQLLRFAVLHVPGVDLALRAFDLFISDPLHHYMETGMLTGIKARAEVGYAHVNGHTDGAATILESLVGACWAVGLERSLARIGSCLRGSTPGEGVIWREQSGSSWQCCSWRSPSS